MCVVGTYYACTRFNSGKLLSLRTPWRRMAEWRYISTYFQALSQNCEKQLLASCLLVRLSVRIEQLGTRWTDFDEILYLCIYRKCVEKIQVSLKFYKNSGDFTWRQYLAEFFLKWAMFQIKVVEKINLRFVFNNFFSENRAVWDNVGKYGGARQAKDGNIIRRMRSAWWITKATDIHSEDVIFIDFAR